MDKLKAKIRDQEEVQLKERQELEDTLRRETEQLRLAKEKVRIFDKDENGTTRLIAPRHIAKQQRIAAGSTVVSHSFSLAVNANVSHLGLTTNK